MQQLLITGARQAEFRESGPLACGEDQLLVRARVTAVSTGTEMRVYRAIPVDQQGQFLHETVPFVLPAPIGYSMVADVLEIGSDVRGFAVGDRVYVPAPHGHLAVMDANLALLLPVEIPDETAVFLNILEVAHIGLRRAVPELGANVAIVGQGVIGLSALAYCRAFGLRATAIDVNTSRLAISGKLGALQTIDASAVDAEIEVQNCFDGQLADVTLETASTWSGIRTAMQATRTNGTVVVVSRHTDMPDFNPMGHPFLGKQLTLRTSYGHRTAGDRWDRQRSMQLTLDLMARGEIDLGPVITTRCRWQQLPEIYAQLDAGDRKMVGIVVDWKES